MERELRELIEQEVERRLEERTAELQEDLQSIRKKIDLLQRERDRALSLLIGFEVTPAIVVNIGNQKPYFSVINWKGQEVGNFDDGEKALKTLLEEKQKGVDEAGLSPYTQRGLTRPW